jgi:hypothetical protein
MHSPINLEAHIKKRGTSLAVLRSLSALYLVDPARSHPYTSICASERLLCVSIAQAGDCFEQLKVTINCNEQAKRDLRSSSIETEILSLSKSQYIKIKYANYGQRQQKKRVQFRLQGILRKESQGK